VRNDTRVDLPLGGDGLDSFHQILARIKLGVDNLLERPATWFANVSSLSITFLRT
jgi:hypothetical protein